MRNLFFGMAILITLTGKAQTDSSRGDSVHGMTVEDLMKQQAATKDNAINKLQDSLHKGGEKSISEMSGKTGEIIKEQSAKEDKPLSPFILGGVAVVAALSLVGFVTEGKQRPTFRASTK